MRITGLRGAVRGRRIRKTVLDPARPCPRDRVDRQFPAPAPNPLWKSDFTHVAAWVGSVSFGPRPRPVAASPAIDTYARWIVEWRVGGSAHSDRSSQYLAIRGTGFLAEEATEHTVGSVGDLHNNALAETVIGLFEAEMIRQEDERKRSRVLIQTRSRDQS